MNKRTIRDLDLKNKRILVRVDFNVKYHDGRILDDTRLRAALPTLRFLLDQPAGLLLCSHLGRPKAPNPKDSLKLAAERLGELLGQPVPLAPDCVGPEAERAARGLKPGQAVMLENVRFHPEEEQNDPDFARQLASLAEVYVNDAFGSAHRAHASTEGVAHYLPAVAGFLMEKEIEYLGRAVSNPEHPFVAILGGAKVSDKIGVIESLLARADRVLIGGGMANTFFKAQGVEVGDSLVEDGALDTARALLERGRRKLVLPTDAVLADRFDAQAESRSVAVRDGVPAGWRILDIGPATLQDFAAHLAGAKLIVWNGPMGVFEFPRFAAGTQAVARLLADSGAVTVIGGGESAAAVQQAGVADRMTHVSTGGGASLEFLEGRTLPGVAALLDR